MTRGKLRRWKTTTALQNRASGKKDSSEPREERLGFSNCCRLCLVLKASASSSDPLSRLYNCRSLRGRTPAPGNSVWGPPAYSHHSATIFEVASFGQPTFFCGGPGGSEPDPIFRPAPADRQRLNPLTAYVLVQWVGMLRIDSSSYKRLCPQVMKRDGWKCQVCGSSQNLQVHHKQLRSSTGFG
jgi:hypothetical protein